MVPSSSRRPAPAASSPGIVFAGLLSIPLALFAAGSAEAYLMLIRQGQESAGLAQPGDLFGSSLVAGDFDGDGFDDLAMGAPSENEDVNPGFAHGSVVVSYGGLRGIRHTGADYLTVGAVPDTDIRYGRALAAGDFDNDGHDDLAVGLPGADIGPGSAITNGGAVWIHEGSGSGLQGTPNLILEQDDAGGAREAGDQFGFSLVAGRFNDDAYDDLAVGAIGENSGSGAVSIFYGSAAGLTSSGAVTFRTIDFGLIEEAGGNFGWSLAAGDVVGGAQDDLAVGAPFRHHSTSAIDPGQVVVLRGSASGITGTSPLIIDPSTLAIQIQAEAWFGYSLAIGRFFSTTGKKALAIGEPRYDNSPPGLVNSGRVVVMEQVTLPPPAGTVKRLEQGTNNDPNNLEAPEPNDQFGWSLAAGDWDNDGDDELAVGTPFENEENNPANGFTSLDAGNVRVFEGNGSFPFSPGMLNRSLHARILNDSLQTSAWLGDAVAFGRFDDTGRANLAIGAPGLDRKNYLDGSFVADAGQVYVFAPWRQLQSAPHRASVALDCEGQIVYAQRPFDAAPLASITKAMTVLLAAEAIQAGFDSSAVYTVPAWVANNVSGSGAGLLPGEQIRFVDLVKLAVAVSAGDACYAIGDTLTGGNHPWNGLGGTLTTFTNGMTTRAQQLGMLQTNYSNPSGRPLADNWSTAFDQALFIREAMQNPLFRYFVGTRQWNDIPNYSPTNYNWLISTQDSWYAATDGVKPGNNAYALHTRLSTALDSDDGLGRSAVCVIGVGSTQYNSPVTDSPAGTVTPLMVLADADCGPSFAPPPPPPPPGPWETFTHLPTGPIPPKKCGLTDLTAAEPGNGEVWIFAQDLPSPPARGDLCLRRESEARLAPGGAANFGFGPIGSHLGFRLYNGGRLPVNLQITTSHPSQSYAVQIPSEGEHVIPGLATGAPLYALTVVNTSSTQGALVQVEERGYKARFSVNAGSPFQGALTRHPATDEEVVQLCIDGGDPTGGNTVYAVIKSPTGTVDAPPPGNQGAGSLRVWAAPTPFRDATAFGFTLPAAGAVRAELFDARGRLVRRLDAGTTRRAGEHRLTWDGRDDDGRGVPVGFYWLRLETPSGVGVGKVLRLP